MIKGILRVLYVLAVGTAFAWGQTRVAIFDFDARNPESLSDATYIQQRLIEIDSKLVIDHYSAGGDELRAIATLKEIDERGYALLILITSDALRIANHFVSRTPCLFTNVNNPLFLGIRDLAEPGHMRSGVTYYVPIKDQIAFFLTVVPGTKRIGFVFDDTNASRDVELRETRNECANAGVEPYFALVTRKEELPAAAQDLIAHRVEMIVLSSSDVVYNNVAMILPITDPAKVPLFSFNSKAVPLGAVGSLASDYRVIIDTLLLPMAIRVLQEGTDPGTLPVARVSEPFIYVNRTKASQLGIDIPTDVFSKSAAVY